MPFLEFSNYLCGYYGDPTTCSSTMVMHYQKRISGPLMDRIDIHMQVLRVEYQKLRDMRPGETSAERRPAQARRYCALDDASQALMKTAMRQLQLMARAYYRVLKLSRTIEDMVASEIITQVHLAEALQYWPKLNFM
jgi:magnesium chelatase family protein